MVNRRVIIFQIEDMLSKINKENLLTFGGHIDNGSAFLELMTNVLTLLKEQEAVKPRVDKDGSFYCGNCGEPVGFDEHPFACKVPEIAMKFCCECGKPVKWE